MEQGRPKSKPSRVTSPSYLNKNKRGTSGRKKRKAPEPYVSRYPYVEFDIKYPDIKINLKLTSPKVDNNANMELIVPTSYTLIKLAELINEKHNNSARNIVFYNETKEKSLSKFMHMNFVELGLSGELNLYYEFSPVIHPILEAGLA
jgi:hypothetical protein